MSRPLLPEPAVQLVNGTKDRLPKDHVRLAQLESLLLDSFSRAGYDRLATPILEPVELHERKSGAGIVSKLFLISGAANPRVCLRPELTAGVVRAYTATEPPPALPWRVSHSGPAFRHEDSSRSDRLREFHQVGLERLGDSGPYADAEVIWLAAWALAEAGVRSPSIRIGHVGLILEILTRSGLPSAAQTALIEMLSEAATEGGDAGSIERGLDHFEDWLRQASDSEASRSPNEPSDDEGIDRLFRTLVPVINGRRSRSEIVGRLQRKWELSFEMLAKLGQVRGQVRSLAQLRGNPAGVLDRLTRDFEAWAPNSVASLRTLFESLKHHGINSESTMLDLGLGRGIGFYSQMIFDLTASTPDGTIELGGGGRYDGLARVLGSDRDDRGVGFAFGLERIDQVLRAQSVPEPHQDRLAPRAVLVIPGSIEATSSAVNLAAQIRSNGGRAILESGWHSSDLVDRAGSLLARWSAVVNRSETGEPAVVLHDHAKGSTSEGSILEVVRSLQDQNRKAPR